MVDHQFLDLLFWGIHNAARYDRNGGWILNKLEKVNIIPPKWRATDGLGERLKEAFGTDRLQSIADQVEMSYQGLDHLIKGRRKLTDDFLLRVSSLTNCSIHWLLTAQGPKQIEAESAGLLPKSEGAEIISPQLKQFIRSEIVAALDGMFLTEKDREFGKRILEGVRQRLEEKRS